MPAKKSRTPRRKEEPDDPPKKAVVADAPQSNELQIALQKIRDLEERLAVKNDGSGMDQRAIDVLQQRLQTYREDHTEVTRAYRDVEMRNEELTRHNEMLEQKLKNMKEKKTPEADSIDRKDARIKELEVKVARYEALQVKNRQTHIQSITDVKKLEDTNRRYQAQIADVDTALVELMSRNKQLSEALNEAQQRAMASEMDLKSAHKEIKELSRKLSSRTVENSGGRSQKRLISETNFTETKEKLIIAENTVNDLKQQVEALKTHERRAARLQAILSQREEQIAQLQDDWAQSDMELQSYRRYGEEVNRQKQEASDRSQREMELAENEKNALEVQLQYYKKLTEREFKRNAELEDSARKAEQDVKDIQGQLDEIMSGKYGLIEAVQEIRKLRAMVSVRDAHIADMINESRWYERVICEFERMLPEGFDRDAFFGAIERKETESDFKRIEGRVVKLVQARLVKEKD